MLPRIRIRVTDGPLGHAVSPLNSPVSWLGQGLTQGNWVNAASSGGGEAYEILIVPGGGLPPGADGHFAGRLAGEIMRHMLKCYEVCCGVAHAHPAVIVAKDHVHHPMQTVLNGPVAADGAGDPLCSIGERGDVESGFRLDLLPVSRVLSTMMMAFSPTHSCRS